MWDRTPRPARAGSPGRRCGRTETPPAKLSACVPCQAAHRGGEPLRAVWRAATGGVARRREPGGWGAPTGGGGQASRPSVTGHECGAGRGEHGVRLFLTQRGTKSEGTGWIGAQRRWATAGDFEGFRRGAGARACPVSWVMAACAPRVRNARANFAYEGLGDNTATARACVMRVRILRAQWR